MSFFDFLFSWRKKSSKAKSSVKHKNVVRTRPRVHEDGKKTSNPVQQGTITAGRLNVRDNPSKHSNVIGKLTRGAVIAVTEKTSDGWCKFKYNGHTAYVSSKFVSFMKGIITARILNFRDKPAKNSNVIGKLNKGTEVEILYHLTGWYQIKAEGKSGYVSSKFVEITGGTSSGGNSGGNNSNDNGSTTPPSGNFLKNKKSLLSVQLEANHKIKLPIKASRAERITATIYNQYGALLKQLSGEIGIDMVTAIAVMAVESGGKGFGNTGKPLIRFENHLFYRFWGKRNPNTFARHFKYNSRKRWTGHLFRKNRSDSWTSFHGNQSKEWEVLDFARTLNNNAALMSASYGLPQVIGSNARRLGYANAQEMVEHFEKDIRYHIIGLFDFFDDNMVHHLKRKHFTEFAKLYNGRGQAVRYGKFINSHYRAFKKL